MNSLKMLRLGNWHANRLRKCTVWEKGNHLDQLIKEAGSETELEKYLAKFKNREKFTFKDIIKDIEKGEGSLTKSESIFLIIHQFIKEKGEKIDTK